MAAFDPHFHFKLCCGALVRFLSAPAAGVKVAFGIVF